MVGLSRGGMVALAAGVLAAGTIGYRLYTTGDSAAGSAAADPADPLAALERAAEADPGNPGAWQQLAFAYFGEGRYADAAKAYGRAAELDPKKAVLWSSLGEALVMASERDPMPPAARDAFAKAIALDPKDPRARYFRAVDKDLGGDHEGAITDWLALLADTPEGAPWEGDLVRTIDQVGRINQIAVAPRVAAAQAGRPKGTPVMAGIPGPTQEQIAAASALSPSEQQNMAEGMVASLASRLEKEPADVQGWIMLMRSYKTLGREADAKAALQKAQAANPAARGELTEAARVLGVG